MRTKVYINNQQDFIKNQGAGRFLSYISQYSPQEVEIVEDFREAEVLLLAVKFDQLKQLSENQKVIVRLDNIDKNFIDQTKKLYNRADKLVFQAEYSKELHETLFGEIDKPYKIIPNGPPFPMFVRKSIFKKVMISVGTWADIPAYKSYYPGSPKATDLFDTITEISEELFSRFSDLEWWIAGEFLSQEVVDMSKKHSNLVLLGRLSKKDLFKKLSLAHLMYHPGQNDNCPYSVVEALVHSVPVIYFKSGGVPDLVKDAGVGIKSREFSQVVPAVDTILSNYRKYSKLAKMRGKEFDITNIAKKYWEFILS